jgi:hypothetical protein
MSQCTNFTWFTYLKCTLAAYFAAMCNLSKKRTQKLAILSKKIVPKRSLVNCSNTNQVMNTQPKESTW